MGYDLATSAVKRTGHGYTGGEKLLYEVCATGKAQHPLAAGVYTTVAVTGTNKDNWFTLKDSSNAAVTLTKADATNYQAQTECATWSQILDSGAKNVIRCGALDAACAEEVAASGTGATAVAQHSKFTLKQDDDGTTAVTFTAGERVRYVAANNGTAAKTMKGMTAGDVFTVAAVKDTTDKFTLAKADGTLVKDAEDENNTIATAGGAAPHKFHRMGAAWKSITTTAKPAAGSSNFHVMVATVF